MLRLWNRGSRPGATCSSSNRESDEGLWAHPHRSFENGTQWASKSVQSVPGYLCNRAVGEGAAQGGFQRTPTETLWWVHRASPAPVLLQWCQLGWDPPEPLCRGLHAVISFSLGIRRSDTWPSPEGSQLRLSRTCLFRLHTTQKAANPFSGPGWLRQPRRLAAVTNLLLSTDDGDSDLSEAGLITAR